MRLSAWFPAVRITLPNNKWLAKKASQRQHDRLARHLSGPVHLSQVILLVFDNPELKNLSRYVRSYLGGLKTLCVEVDGQEWKYLDGGKGEVILFLHGGAGSKTQWRSLMQTYLPDYRVIAIDVPGLNIGQSFISKRHSFRQYGVWLCKVLDQLRLDKVHLVGASMGSAIAAYYAAQHPGRVLSLAILGFPDAMLTAERDVETVLQSFFGSEAIRTVEDLQRAYDRAFFKSPLVPKIVLSFNLREWLRYQDSFYQVVRELLVSRPVLMAGLRQIRVPTLILQGAEDQLCRPLEPGYWQRQIPQAQFHVLGECGHMIQIEKTDETARLHRSLLRHARPVVKPFDAEEESAHTSSVA